MKIPTFNLGDLVSHIASPNTIAVITKLVPVGEQVMASLTHVHAEAGSPSVTTQATHPTEALKLVDLENHPVEISQEHEDAIAAVRDAVLEQAGKPATS